MQPEAPPPQPPPLPPQQPVEPTVSQDQEDDLLAPGERVLTVIHRSSIGIIGIYIFGLVTAAAAIALIIEVSPSMFDTPEGKLSVKQLGLVAIASLLLAFGLFIITYVYRQSRLLITNRSLVQITQRSLFSRKVSRLSMSNVEDVSAEQRGVLATVFNYGTLTVQTAGEEDNFIFSMCPNPNKLADKVIEARQVYAHAPKADQE